MARSKDKLIHSLLFLTIFSGIACALLAYFLGHEPAYWQVSGGVFVLSAIAYFIKDANYYKGLFARKTARFGLLSMVTALFGLAVVVVINLVFYEHDWKIDLTKNQLHSLSEQSVQVMKNLDKKVDVKVFVFPKGRPGFERALGKYSYFSDKIAVEYIDPDKHAPMVKEYQVKQAGTLVFESESRIARVEDLRGPEDPKIEEKITNAIIRVAKGDKKKIYFISGHKEKPLKAVATQPGQNRLDAGGSYSHIKSVLEGNRYQVETLSLFDKKEIPKDAEIVVLAGPQSNFFPHELKVIETYVRGGGRFLVMVDPNAPKELKPFLAKFGATWRPGWTIVERNQLRQMGQRRSANLLPIVKDYDKSHAITKNNAYPSVFFVSSAIKKAEKTPEGMKAVSLFKTSPYSEEGHIKNGRIHPSSLEKKGPYSLAVAISGDVKGKAKPKEKKEGEESKDEKSPEFRMVVVGDSDFVSDAGFNNGMNSDLFQNMLAWLAEEEDLISMRPKSQDGGKFEITVTRLKVIRFASMALLPLMMFISGIFVWQRRKRM